MKDYWVEVWTEEGYNEAREVFINKFTRKYMEGPDKFAFQYGAADWEPRYFPGGCFAVIINNIITFKKEEPYEKQDLQERGHWEG